MINILATQTESAYTMITMLGKDDQEREYYIKNFKEGVNKERRTYSIYFYPEMAPVNWRKY